MPPDGKSDMDRIGLFKEMGYVSIGDKYTSLFHRHFNESAHKDRQMLTAGVKSRSALQEGYFDSQFKRIFESEAFTDPLKIARQYRSEQAKKIIGKAFLPSNGEKKPSGFGSNYGTFGGPTEAMSGLQIPRVQSKSPGKNFYTKPPKKGSGYGYPDVTLSKIPPYPSDPYDRASVMLKEEIMAHKAKFNGPFRLNLHPNDCFDQNPYKHDKPLPPPKKTEDKRLLAIPFKPSSPSKKAGGMKAGTFESYPTHTPGPSIIRNAESAMATKDRKIFHPSSGPKSKPVQSIITLNVSRAMNSTNYKQNFSVMAY